MTININQMRQAPVRGQLDWDTMNSGVFSAQVSANETGTLKAGDPVALDATVTAGQLPQIVLAAQADLAIGFIPHNVKQDSFVAGDRLEIAFLGGPVMWLQATAVAIAPGAQVENSGDTGALIQALASGSMRGIALDYIPASGLGRVILGNAKLIHA